MNTPLINKPDNLLLISKGLNLIVIVKVLMNEVLWCITNQTINYQTKYPKINQSLGFVCSSVVSIVAIFLVV